MSLKKDRGLEIIIQSVATKRIIMLKAIKIVGLKFSSCIIPVSMQP